MSNDWSQTHLGLCNSSNCFKVHSDEMESAVDRCVQRKIDDIYISADTKLSASFHSGSHSRLHIEIVVTPRERECLVGLAWAISERIPARLYIIIGLVAAY